MGDFERFIKTYVCYNCGKTFYLGYADDEDWRDAFRASTDEAFNNVKHRAFWTHSAYARRDARLDEAYAEESQADGHRYWWRHYSKAGYLIEAKAREFNGFNGFFRLFKEVHKDIPKYTQCAQCTDKLQVLAWYSRELDELAYAVFMLEEAIKHVRKNQDDRATAGSYRGLNRRFARWEARLAESDSFAQTRKEFERLTLLRSEDHDATEGSRKRRRGVRQPANR